MQGGSNLSLIIIWSLLSFIRDIYPSKTSNIRPSIFLLLFKKNKRNKGDWETYFAHFHQFGRMILDW